MTLIKLMMKPKLNERLNNTYIQIHTIHKENGDYNSANAGCSLFM